MGIFQPHVHIRNFLFKKSVGMIGNDRELPRYSKGAVGIKGAGFLVGLKCGPDHEKI